MFTSLTKTIFQYKNQYFPNNQVEKELFDIINSSNLFLNLSDLKKIAEYTNNPNNLLIVKRYILNYLNSNTHYNQLNNLLNLIEHLIFNGNFDFVITCKITFKSKLYDLVNSYIFLDNGIDKGLQIKNKIDNILWILENENYLLSERNKIVEKKNQNNQDLKLNYKFDTNESNLNNTIKNNKPFNIKIKPLEKSESSTQTHAEDLINFDQKYIKHNNNNLEIKIKKIVPIKKNTNGKENNQIKEEDLIGLNDFY